MHKKTSFRTDFASQNRDTESSINKEKWHECHFILMFYNPMDCKNWIPHLATRLSACAVRYDDIFDF